MKSDTNQQGKEGEDAAASYLVKKGYSILERNWRFKKYEIDIIAKKDNVVAIIEVKSRKNNTFGEPEIFVGLKKQNFLIAAAHQYIIEREIECECRFDIVAILALDTNPKINHLEAAFYPVAK